MGAAHNCWVLCCLFISSQLISTPSVDLIVFVCIYGFHQSTVMGVKKLRALTEEETMNESDFDIDLYLNLVHQNHLKASKKTFQNL
jgi:hypothetical protein